MQTALSLSTCTFSFKLFFCLLWLGIHNGSIFFIQIQLNVKSVQPFCFSFSSSSKAKGFLISSFAVSSCAIVSAFLVLAASSLTGSFDSSFSIRVRFPRASAPKSTLCFSAKVHTVMGVDGIIMNLHLETSIPKLGIESIST